MRDVEATDSELQLLSRAWRVARVLCDRMPSTELIDQLLDERAKALAGVGAPARGCRLD
jgi:hypothetical protein